MGKGKVFTFCGLTGDHRMRDDEDRWGGGRALLRADGDGRGQAALRA